MFKKKPQIKNLSPLRSSERRRLADQIRKDYSLPDPTSTPQPSDAPQPEPEAPPPHPSQPSTLTSIRNSLLPESTSSAKFLTTHGASATPVAGTVYVGAHPGQDERVLWFQVGKEDRLIPTVYTLWQNPNLVPLLLVADAVVQRLKNGADLFAPGVLVPTHGFDDRLKKGAVVALAGVGSDTVPRWVGTSLVEGTELHNRAGGGGTAARGLQWEGDELWSWHPMNKGGSPAPDRIDDWERSQSKSGSGERSRPSRDDQEDDHDDGDDDDDHDDDDDDHLDGGVELAKSAVSASVGSTAADRHGPNGHGGAPTGPDEDEGEEEPVPTTQEVDQAFVEAFVYSVYDAKKRHSAEPYGFDLPIQASYLIANMVQPHLRLPNQHYHIKKTSWKNARKFIKHLDKTVLVRSKDRNGGQTVILDIDFDDERIKTFQPYPLPKPKPSSPANATSTGKAGASSDDPSINQKLSIQILYRASAKLVPELLPSKTAYYTSQQVIGAVKTYVEAHPDLVNPSKKRYVKLDPFLANNVLGSNASAEDHQIRSAGEIDRAVLGRRILDDDHLCVPYHLVLHGDESYTPDPPGQKPGVKAKPGLPHKVLLTIERRGGNKVVTAISHLEAFNINPHVLKPDLQKKCAGSASIAQCQGGKPGTMEVTVQGDQRVTVEKELSRRGVRAEWIEVIDKSKKGGKGAKGLVNPASLVIR